MGSAFTRPFSSANLPSEICSVVTVDPLLLKPAVLLVWPLGPPQAFHIVKGGVWI